MRLINKEQINQWRGKGGDEISTYSRGKNLLVCLKEFFAAQLLEEFLWEENNIIAQGQIKDLSKEGCTTKEWCHWLVR